jgi:hypothetical protein
MTMMFYVAPRPRLESAHPSTPANKSQLIHLKLKFPIIGGLYRAKETASSEFRFSEIKIAKESGGAT